VRMTLVCVASMFIACSSSSSSPSGGTGDGGAADAGGSGQIGDACPNGTSDCASGLLCAGEDPGGGQCYKTCAPSKDADCGDTSKYACSSEGHCYLRCNQTSDCKRASQGYVCKDDEPARPPVKFCDVSE
jgi:hypothetical protein